MERFAFEWNSDYGTVRIDHANPTVGTLHGREGMSFLFALRDGERAKIIAALRKLADEMEVGL